MTTIGALVLLIVVLVVVLALLLRWVLSGRRAALGRVEALVAGEPAILRDDAARSFGLASRGVRQVRGNGCLALTPTRLVFAQWSPRRDLVVPRVRIGAVDTPRGHAGKASIGHLLRVSFTDDLGRDESCAWQIRALDRWTAALALPPAPGPPPPPRPAA